LTYIFLAYYPHIRQSEGSEGSEESEESEEIEDRGSRTEE
jgi:hypothetical protein